MSKTSVHQKLEALDGWFKQLKANEKGKKGKKNPKKEEKEED